MTAPMPGLAHFGGECLGRVLGGQFRQRRLATDVQQERARRRFPGRWQVDRGRCRLGLVGHALQLLDEFLRRMHRRLRPNYRPKPDRNSGLNRRSNRYFEINERLQTEFFVRATGIDVDKMGLSPSYSMA
jgi:hypothetical protein